MPCVKQRLTLAILKTLCAWLRGFQRVTLCVCGVVSARRRGGRGARLYFELCVFSMCFSVQDFCIKKVLLGRIVCGVMENGNRPC